MDIVAKNSTALNKISYWKRRMSDYCKLDLATLRFLAGLLEILFRFNPVNEVLRAELKVVISEINRREL